MCSEVLQAMKIINCATLKTENASLMRKRPSSPHQRIVNHALHKEYGMAAVFWDHKHLLPVDVCDVAGAVTAAHYYGTPEQIQHAICRSSHGFLQQGMITVTPGSILPAGLGIGYFVTAGGYWPSSLQSQSRTLLYPFFFLLHRTRLASKQYTSDAILNKLVTF